MAGELTRTETALRQLAQVAGPMRERILADPELAALYETARRLISEADDTGMRLYEGEDWHVPADFGLEAEDSSLTHPTNMRPVRGHNLVPHAKLRRVGWLDQKGHVWAPGDRVSRPFIGGSLTPLLIDVREH